MSHQKSLDGCVLFWVGSASVWSLVQLLDTSRGWRSVPATEGLLGESAVNLQRPGLQGGRCTCRIGGESSEEDEQN